MIHLVIAMDREADMLIPRIRGTLIDQVHVVGIGCADFTPETSEDDIIVNVGYAGGYRVPIGRVIEPTFALRYGTGEGEMIDHLFSECERYRCYTADEFVTQPCSTLPAIYDMELARLEALPHKKLFALKIVSDKLNEKECEMFDSVESWGRVVKLLKQYF